VESLPNSEQFARRMWLTQNLAEKGEMNPEIQEVLGLWTAAEEKVREDINEPNYLLTMELARIYEEAGLSSVCDYYLDIAYYDARKSGDEEMCQKIRDIFKQ
jgi:hypothetical protein